MAAEAVDSPESVVHSKKVNKSKANKIDLVFMLEPLNFNIYVY